MMSVIQQHTTAGTTFIRPHTIHSFTPILYIHSPPYHTSVYLYTIHSFTFILYIRPFTFILYLRLPLPYTTTSAVTNRPTLTFRVSLVAHISQSALGWNPTLPRTLWGFTYAGSSGWIRALGSHPHCRWRSAAPVNDCVITVRMRICTGIMRC